MPGEADFSNSFLPQQPFNSCLFPSIAQRKNRSLNLVTNPHQFEMEGLTFLGSGGQNIKDIMMNCDPTSAFKDVVRDEKDQIKFDEDNPPELQAAMLTLQMRHLCPTAPDTMRVFPFKESDPFVIADKDLALEDQDEKQIHTEVPHVYFSANAPKYSSRLEKQGNHFVKVMTIPDYSRT